MKEIRLTIVNTEKTYIESGEYDKKDYELINIKTNEPIGECTIIDYSSYNTIWNVRIFDEFQNEGYGTLMIKDIIKKCKPKRQPLVLYVDRDNEIAIRFYKKLGFKIINDELICLRDYLISKSPYEAFEMVYQY